VEIMTEDIAALAYTLQTDELRQSHVLELFSGAEGVMGIRRDRMIDLLFASVPSDSAWHRSQEARLDVHLRRMVARGRLRKLRRGVYGRPV